MKIHDLSGVEIIGSGEPLVFLHSSLSSNKQWLMAIKLLSEHFTCINLDMLGYGRAPDVADNTSYSFADEISRIEKTLEYLGLHEQPVHLVGHSCGGAIALAMAAKTPEKIASMTLFEPVAFHLLNANFAEYYQQICDFALQLKDMPNDKAAMAFVDFWNGKDFYQALPAKVQLQMATAMEKVHLDFQGILMEQYQLADLAKITCPTMMMMGKETQPISKVLSREIYNQLVNVELRELPGGHMAPISHSSHVTQQIVSFLKENKKAR